MPHIPYLCVQLGKLTDVHAVGERFSEVIGDGHEGQPCRCRLLGTGPDRSLAVAVVSMSVQVKTFDQGIPSFIMKTSGASGSLSPEAPKQEF
jgi:hypothetical protein